jgi:hypothetical protein
MTAVHPVVIRGSVLRGSVLAASLGLFASTATADVLAHYRADGNCLDSARANHGALQNGAGFGPGIVGQAFQLDGVNDYVSAPEIQWLAAHPGLTVDAKPCPLDLNRDGLVDGADLGALLGSWGACP